MQFQVPRTAGSSIASSLNSNALYHVTVSYLKLMSYTIFSALRLSTVTKNHIPAEARDFFSLPKPGLAAGSTKSPI